MLSTLSPETSNILCSIIGHEVKKHVASPRRRFNRIRRKIPERSGYYVEFLLEICQADESCTVRRRYADFKALHQMLRRKFPRATIPLTLPRFKSRRYDNCYISSRVVVLNRYLKQLLQVPQVSECEIVHRFLDDEYHPDQSGDDQCNSARVLLQSLPDNTVVVKKGHSFELNLDVTRAESIVAWEYRTKKYDIAFIATFNDAEVSCYTREETHLRPADGFFLCPTPGIFKLIWDNSYSWRRAKRLSYRAEVMDPDLLSATSRFVDAEEIDQPREPEAKSLSLRTALGRMPRPSPRKLVGSISRFRSRSPRHSFDSQKVGYLFMNRGRKFRRSHWYKKWCLLDVKQGLFCYYSKEPVSRYRRPQRRLRLANKNASLSIVRRDATAPTPYCLIVTSGSRRWEICAENSVDFESWREALTSAIVLAQWTRNDPAQSGNTEETEEIDDDFVDDEQEEVQAELADDVDDFDDDSDDDELQDEKGRRWGLQYIPRHHLQADPSIKIPRRHGPNGIKVLWILCVNLTLVFLKLSDPWALSIALAIFNIFFLWSLLTCTS